MQENESVWQRQIDGEILTFMKEQTEDKKWGKEVQRMRLLFIFFSYSFVSTYFSVYIRAVFILSTHIPLIFNLVPVKLCWSYFYWSSDCVLSLLPNIINYKRIIVIFSFSFPVIIWLTVFKQYISVRLQFNILGNIVHFLLSIKWEDKYHHITYCKLDILQVVMSIVLAYVKTLYRPLVSMQFWVWSAKY